MMCVAVLGVNRIRIHASFYKDDPAAELLIPVCDLNNAEIEFASQLAGKRRAATVSIR